MNEKKEWKERLELANNDLKQYGIWLVIEEPEEGFFSLIIAGPGLDDRYTFAENYYENELGELINDAHVHARARGEHLKRRDLPVLDRKLHLFCESVQEVTLCAWPIIWADNKYDQDSRVVLETIRGWAWEFESWWLSHDESWRDRHDYIEEVVVFTRNKCKEYLKELGVEPEPAKQPTTEDRGHIEERIEVIQDLMEICHDEMAGEDRAWAFETIRNWGTEFAKHWYCEMTDEEREEKDYFEAIQKFAEAMLKTIRRRDFVVTLKRNETIEVKVLVSADDWREAVDKVETAWREDESFARKVLDHAEEGEVECSAHESTGVDEQVDLAL